MTIYRDYGETYAQLGTAVDEYVFSKVTPDGQSLDFIVCNVFLHSVLDAAEPDHNGWQGILLQYHCDMEWLDEPWTIPDLHDVIRTLTNISQACIAGLPFGQDALRILPELLEFLSQAETEGKDVVLTKR